MSDIPHFDYPFRFVNGHAHCVEQDSADEVVNAAMAVLKTSPGFRAELPDFGCPEQAFHEGGPDLEVIHHALDAWEPRAGYTLDKVDIDSLTQEVIVGVRSVPNAK